MAYNVGLHWSLIALVHHDGNHYLFHMDSLNAHDSALAGKRCLDFLRACHVACDPTKALPSYLHRSSMPKVISCKVPQQSNAHSCGCFTVQYTIKSLKVMLQKTLPIFVQNMCSRGCSAWFPVDTSIIMRSATVTYLAVISHGREVLHSHLPEQYQQPQLLLQQPPHP